MVVLFRSVLSQCNPKMDQESFPPPPTPPKEKGEKNCYIGWLQLFFVGIGRLAYKIVGQQRGLPYLFFYPLKLIFVQDLHYREQS